MVDCRKTKLRYRADQVFWAALREETAAASIGGSSSDSEGSKSSNEEGEVVCYVTVMEGDDMLAEATKAALKKAKSLGKIGPFKPLQLRDLTEAPASIYRLIPSPGSGEAGDLTPPRDFNLMFQTSVGAIADASATAYLRPETAQVYCVLYVCMLRAA